MKLLLFTYSYPFGGGETFLENEIDFLAQEFEEVIIFPSVPLEGERPLPENCSVLLFKPENNYRVRKIVFSNFWVICRLIVNDLFSKINRKALFNPKKYFNELIGVLTESRDLEIFLLKNNIKENRLFYTYWFYEWTSVISLIKKKGDTLITRSHGFDFNLEDYDNTYFAFRPYVLKQLDQNFNVSQFGFEYLVNKYAKYKDKIRLGRLGVKDQNHIVLSDNKTVVSCSGIIPLKRIHLIVELLKVQTREIHWVHFGEGDEKANILELCKELPNNVTFDFKGALSNTEVINWYKTNKAMAFLHFSFSEGLPVALMEAQSFGIPILSCDAGGVKEIVTEKTGVLLKNKFTLEESIQGFEEIVKEKNFDRNRIQNYQQAIFSSKRNYTLFIKTVKKLAS